MNSENDQTFFQWTSRLWQFVSFFIAIFVFFAAILSIPLFWEARKQSRDRIERWYWNIMIVWFLSVIYLLGSILYLPLFDIFAETNLGNYLVTTWGLFTAIAVCFTAPFISCVFGSHDRDTLDYNHPEWHRTNLHLADADQCLYEVTLKQPSLDAEYAHLSEQEKLRLNANWGVKYLEAIRRHQQIYEMYNRTHVLSEHQIGIINIAKADEKLYKASLDRPSLLPKYAHFSEKEKRFVDINWLEIYEKAAIARKEAHKTFAG
jgi:hypothetical protein